MLRQIWQVFRQRYPSGPKAFAVMSAFVGVLILIGASLVVAGAAGLAWTSTEEFCIGCH